jgi:transposase
MHGRRKNYRAWDAQQCSQEPVAPRDALPEDDLVFFLLDLVPQIDLSPFHQYYAQELRGQPPFDVTMMVTLLVYAYSVGVCSSRRVAAACERNLAFRAIVGDDPPDFRTISDFRKIHLAAFRPLFLEVLRLAGEMGMVKLGNLSTDGTKMGANASRHKAMSYGYMNKEIQRLEAEIEQLLKQAEQLDAEQDAALGACPNICSCSRMAAGFRWALAFSASAQPCARTLPLNRPRRCRSGARSSKDCGSSRSVATRPTLSPGRATETCGFLART